ncbi:MAG: hypothetical protein IIB67_06680 [Proteobacteria bacterium]|nr:hypothetical protein [Pseudomonadota bacterium]
MIRVILIGVVVAVIGAVGVFMFVLSSLDGIILEAVETYGSEITQAKVSLAAVELDLTSGRGSLRGLSVGNPKGFNTPSAFELGAISITIDSCTVSDDTIVINEIVIDAPVVTYELGADGSNIDAIQRNVEAYMAQFGDDPADDGGEGPKLIIDDLYIRGGKVNISATFLDGKALSAELPDIHLEDIGREDEGASPAAIAEQIIAALTAGTTGAVSSLGLEEIMGGAGKLLEGVAEGAGELLESVTSGGEGAGEALEGVVEGAGEALEGAGEALEGAAEGAAKALGNLFGGSSD